MAENTENVTTEVSEVDSKPTVEDLMSQLAALRADNKRLQSDNLKLKSSNDKLSSESAENKRALRAKQTAEEQAAADLAEAQKKQDEYTKGLEREIGVYKATNRYMDLGMDAAMAAEAAQAEMEGNHEAVTATFKKFQDAVLSAKQAEWLKGRPQVQSGGTQQTEDDDVAAFRSFFK